VVCEGKTEETLLKELRGHWHIPSVTVKVMGQAGVPATVVDCAVKERKKLGKPVETWVVFDRDEHPKWEDSINRAHAQTLMLAISNPCFELWAILLHQEQTAHIGRHNAQHILAANHPPYHHDTRPYLKLETVLANFGDVTQRAQRLLKCAEEKDDLYGNPTTRFHDLVLRLQALGLEATTYS